MHSDRWPERFKTFRFRLAIYHVLLVSGALTITFIVALSVARSSALADERQHMHGVLLRAKSAYLGGKLPHPPEQLPEDLLEKIEAEFPDLCIGLVERETQPGGFLYEVIGSTGHEWLEILVESTGRSWVADRKPLSEVFGWVAEAARQDGGTDIDLLLYSPQNNLLAASSPMPLPGSSFARIRREITRQEEPFAAKIGPDWFGGVMLYDGNILCVVGHMQEALRITRWGSEFFAVLMAFFIPLSAWIGFYISRKAMAGVRRVTAAAGEVSAGHFTERVVAGGEGSEIKELENAFNTMVARIEMLMRELRDMTVNIAHDLKTPVSAIRGLLESLSWTEVSPEEREHALAAAIEECDRIAPLIDSVLELAQAQTGALVMQKQSFDLAAEVRGAYAIFSSLAEDNRITFTCSVPDMPVYMIGDRSRMQRVIANLVENALKYTPEGGRVSMGLENREQQAVLSVQDSGPGIPSAELERVFERFYRVDAGRTAPGYGLGLSLVKAFVEAMGGTVNVDSKRGEGCIFTVSVPLTMA